jgi:hypothetical protein
VTTPPEPAGKFPWQRLVLSLDIPLPTKAVALVLSIYASRDGSNAHPGNRRLAWALNADKKTIRRHLAVLRDELRLIERTFYGQQAGRRGLSDCYQLVIPWDLPARVKIREYEPDLGTPVSPDNPSGGTGTGDSGGGTGDSEAGTGDTRVPPPGSAHQSESSSSGDSIAAPVPSSEAELEVTPSAPDQDLHQQQGNSHGRWRDPRAEAARQAAEARAARLAREAAP